MGLPSTVSPSSSATRSSLVLSGFCMSPSPMPYHFEHYTCLSQLGSSGSGKWDFSRGLAPRGIVARELVPRGPSAWALDSRVRLTGLARALVVLLGKLPSGSGIGRLHWSGPGPGASGPITRGRTRERLGAWHWPPGAGSSGLGPWPEAGSPETASSGTGFLGIGSPAPDLGPSGTGSPGNRT